MAPALLGAGAIAAWKEKLTPAELAKANLGNGRRVFNQTCFACHTMFGQGIAIGPDITGANRSDLNYVLENILDPNNVVPIDYQLTVFTMKESAQRTTPRLRLSSSMCPWRQACIW